jgi:hypothetical protein
MLLAKVFDCLLTPKHVHILHGLRHGKSSRLHELRLGLCRYGYLFRMSRIRLLAFDIRYVDPSSLELRSCELNCRVSFIIIFCSFCLVKNLGFWLGHIAFHWRELVWAKRHAAWLVLLWLGHVERTVSPL